MAREQQRVSNRELKRLVRKAMRGDAESFTRLYALFINSVYYNASKLLFDQSAVDDAVQEISIVLYKGLAKLESPYTFYAYLYQTTRNVCSSFNRKAKHLRYDDIDEVGKGLVDTANKTPSEALEAKELEEYIQQVISELPQKQREVLQLYYYYNLSYKEIARITNTEAATVGSNLSKAKRNMKTSLDKEAKRRADASVGEQKFGGIPLDVLLASAIVNDIDSALPKDKAAELIQLCGEQIANIAVQAVVGTATIAGVIKAALAGTATVAVVGTAGIVAIENYPHKAPSSTSYTETQINKFIPKNVSIDFVVDDTVDGAGQTAAANPRQATLVSSEGSPLGWVILDETNKAIVQGGGDVIEQRTFESLASGIYRIDWTIVNDKGWSGVATRTFAIYI